MPNPKPPTRLAEPVTEQDHAVGPADAPVTLVEYVDYECPDCLNTLPVVQELRRRVGDRVRFVFRHFPQSSIHPHASQAAIALEAAAEQGKFWDMHEMLFKHQKEFGDLDFGHLALLLGLEIYKFESSRSREAHSDRIRADVDSGERSGVQGTPTFFINGLRYDGPLKADAMIAALDSAADAAAQQAKG
jgi:protein-disulfide isomerase